MGPDTDAYRAQALAAVSAGQYEQAREYFNRALAGLNAGDTNGSIQRTERAECLADRAFTYAQEAANADEQSVAAPLLHQALSELQAARTLANTDTRQPEQGPNSPTTPEARRLSAGRGRVAGELGRAATVAAYRHPTNNAYEEFAYLHNIAREAYTEADKYLLEAGGSDDELIANALAAARHELVVGSYPRMMLWLGRVAYTLTRAGRNNNQDTRYLWHNVLAKAWYLSTIDAAIDSLRTDP